MLRFSVWLSVLSAYLFSTAVASAQISIAAPSCDDLDLEVLTRALDLEIADVAVSFREMSSPVVLLGCAETSVRIEITDPVTDKSVARTVPRPEVDAERVLALAIAQLFLTSWLELLLDGESDAPGAEAAEARALAAVAAALETDPPPEVDADLTLPPEPDPVVAPEPAPDRPIAPRIDGEISLEGGARWRAEGENLGTAVGVLRGQLVIDQLVLVGLRAGLEWGRALRTRGSIDLYSVHLGLVAGLRTPALGPFVLDASVGVGAVLIALEGRPNRADVEGGSTQAVAAEALLELAPTLRVGPVLVSIPLVLSGMAFAPHGVVTEEAPVVTGGVALAAMLRIAIAPGLF